MVNEAGVHDRDWLGFEWSPWVSLHPDDEGVSTFETDPGLYRVRHEAIDGLVYIGETGRSLRGRVQALRRGIYEGEMPFSDPHTASPSLWAIVDRYGPGFEVSETTPEIAADKQQRKAAEEALIALHRRETGTNLVGNFGRMPPGYSKSKRRSTGTRGQQSEDLSERSFRKGIDALDWGHQDPITGPDWMGLDWSDPRPLGDGMSDVPDAGGVYCLWEPNTAPPLTYIGESVTLSNRLIRHRRNRDSTLHVSYALLPELTEKFQLSQAETELLGAHWLACGEAPVDQY